MVASVNGSRVGPGGEVTTTSRRWDPVPLLLVALTLVPFAVGLWHLVQTGTDAISLGDRSVIELSTREAFTRPQLVGSFSRLITRSPGPLQFWVLTPFYWLAGGSAWGLALGAGAVNAVAASSTVFLAYRRGGRSAALVFATAQLALLGALGVLLFDPWNPLMVLVPLGTTAVLAWGVAVGDDRLLPWFALLASYEVQCHLGMAPVVVMLVVVALVGRWVWGSEDSRPERRWWRPRSMPRRGVLWATAAVLLVVWLPPVIESVAHPPGNLARVAKFTMLSQDRQTTLSDGVAIGRYLTGVPPSFVTGDPPTDAGTNLATLGSAPVVPLAAVALIALLLLAWRLRRELLPPLVLASGLVLVGVASVWRVVGPLYGYLVLWTSVAGFVVWSITAWAAWELVAPHLARLVRLGSAVLVALLAVVAMGRAVHAVSGLAPNAEEQREVRALVDAVAGAADPSRPVSVEASNVSEVALAYRLALVTELVKRGYSVVAPGQRKWFDDRDRRPPNDATQVWVFDAEADPSAGGAPSGAVPVYRGTHAAAAMSGAAP